MKISTGAILLLSVFLVFVGLIDIVQSAQQNLQTENTKPIIECEDPAKTGRNACAAGWAKSACEYMCANKAKDQCDWNQNAVRNCQAQCTVANGCTNN